MIYEIINIGKGVITAITPENLLLIEKDNVNQEIQIINGENIEVTGNGTSSEPFIINAIPKYLGIEYTENQEVIASGMSKETITNSNDGRVLVTKEYFNQERNLQKVIDSGGTWTNSRGDVTSSFIAEPELVQMFTINDSVSPTKRALISTFYGGLAIEQTVGNFSTNLVFKTPKENVAILFPSKSYGGNQVVNTTYDAAITVQNLPPSAELNDMAIVRDALNPTYLGIPIGGGSVVCPVWHNGTNWVIR